MCAHAGACLPHAQCCMQKFDPANFPSGPYQHLPDPTATDLDQNGNELPQSFYAPHWGTVVPFGHSSTAALPNPIVGPRDNATNIAQYREDFIEVQELGAALQAGAWHQ